MVEKQDIRVERNVEYEKKQLKDINQLPLFMTAAVTTEFNADMASRCFCIKNDWKAPELKSNEVLVKMLWSSVNPVDYYLNTGKLHLVDAPFVNGRDGCGQIVQLGEEASRHFKMNDIVLGATTNWKYGTFGQYAVFKWDNLCLKPREISSEHAAALPVVLLTAWECFQKIDNPRNLKRILIHGGSGGVGSMAILLAKYYFNIDHVISTCRGSNCDYVKQLGADEVLNYNDVEFDQFLSQKYGKLDLVIDPVGGDVMLEKSYKLLDSKGYYITTVPLKNIDSNTSEIKEIIGFGIQFITNKLKSVFADAPQFFSVLCNYDGKTLDQLAKWMAQKNLHDKFRVTKYPFNEISTAMDQIHSGHTDGKLIIDMSM